jgi:glycosyltransferase involved in cell wall biosynthesis
MHAHVQVPISLVIAVRNGEEALPKLLASVFEQDIKMHECVIVDNGSTDKTAEIIHRFQKDHPEIKYVYEAQRGRGAARNAGLDNATGDIIATTDVDCVLPKDWLRRITEPIVRGRDKVVCGGQYDIAGTYWSRQMQRMGDRFMQTAISPDGYVVFCDTKNFAIDAKLIKSMRFDQRFIALENVEFDYRMRPISRVRYLTDVKVGHRNISTLRETWKLAFERSFWFAQIYHKFKGVRDRNGILIFPIVKSSTFYRQIFFRIDWFVLRDMGLGYLPFFIVFGLGTKLGNAIGFAQNRVNPSVIH